MICKGENQIHLSVILVLRPWVFDEHHILVLSSPLVQGEPRTSHCTPTPPPWALASPQPWSGVTLGPAGVASSPCHLEPPCCALEKLHFRMGKEAVLPVSHKKLGVGVEL